jgi:hypothetical protein
LAYCSRQQSGRTRQSDDESGKSLQDDDDDQVGLVQLAFMNKRYWEGDYYGI